MNEGQLRNEFQGGLADLIREVTEIIAGEGRDPFSDGCDRAPHEHDTRSLFVDRLLILLGWRLGPHGNVLEEARIRAETTRFMDYVGVAEDTQAPLMIFEAKAWDKPYVTARMPGGRETDHDLLVAAIRHLLDGHDHKDAPVTGLWHDYLVQVSGYVNTMKSRYGHDTPRAVLASGQWLIVFTEPVKTFVNGAVSSDHIRIFKLEDYVRLAEDLFGLLHRSKLAQDVPFPLRPAQLRQYVDHASVTATFHGLHVHFEATGSPLYGPRPQVLVYPVLIVQRNDGVLITVTDCTEGLHLSYKKVPADSDDVEDLLRLDDHLVEVNAGAVGVLAACESELGGTLAIRSLDHFPGFPVEPARLAEYGPRMVRSLKGHSNEWLMVTGIQTHYLTETPLIDPCRFHSWAACQRQGHGIGASALSIRSVDPRAVFIDTEAHHCAHQVVQDRRLRRCHIMAIDQRTCCQACIYANNCWSTAEQAGLPCGN